MKPIVLILGGGMMNEKRFYYLTYNLNEDDEYYEIIDKKQRYSFNFIKDEWLATQVCDCLNERQKIINELGETNGILLDNLNKELNRNHQSSQSFSNVFDFIIVCLIALLLPVFSYTYVFHHFELQGFSIGYLCGLIYLFFFIGVMCEQGIIKNEYIKFKKKCKERDRI